jgi:hypothetical protein
MDCVVGCGHLARLVAVDMLIDSCSLLRHSRRTPNHTLRDNSYAIEATVAFGRGPPLGLYGIKGDVLKLCLRHMSPIPTTSQTMTNPAMEFLSGDGGGR